MRNSNETRPNQNAVNNEAITYIAMMEVLCGVAVLLTFVCLFRYKSQPQISTAENQHRITSSNAITTRTQQELPRSDWSML